MKNKIVIMILALLMVSFSYAADEVSVLKLSVAKTDPLIVESGDYFTLYLKLDNIGSGDSRGIVVEFIDNYPFSVESERVQEINILGAQKDYVLEYRVRVDPNAIEGNNILKVKYEDRYGAQTEKEFNINVENNNADLVVGSIESSPLNLVADTDDAKLSINLQNIGESKAKMISAKLELPEGFTPSNSFSDMDSISSIESEESEDAIFYIDIDESVEEKAYDAKLILSYKEDNNDEYITKELDLKLPVKATPLFEVENVRLLPENPMPEDVVEMLVTLKNVGGEDAESVSIRAFQSVGLPVDFDEKSDFIGTIKKGQVGSAVLKFTVDADAVAKEYLLDLEIRAVSNQEVLVFDKTVNFLTQESNKSSAKTVGIIAVVGVLLVIGYFYFKKK
ncbi:hypothetical protein BVX95_00485 [archaeon D22]|nr:hypothetical protein BVX95_00485 [archaeon D22]